MSWSWNEHPEKKEYDYKGTVTISTEEYSDLIRTVCDLQAKGQKEHDDWIAEARAKDEAIRKLKEAEKKLSEYAMWLEADDTAKMKHKTWLLAVMGGVNE